MPRVEPETEEVAPDHGQHRLEEGLRTDEAVEERHVRDWGEGGEGHGKEEGDSEML
jgi:hypothetical protein